MLFYKKLLLMTFGTALVLSVKLGWSDYISGLQCHKTRRAELTDLTIDNEVASSINFNNVIKDLAGIMWRRIQFAFVIPPVEMSTHSCINREIRFNRVYGSKDYGKFPNATKRIWSKILLTKFLLICVYRMLSTFWMPEERV